MQENSQLNSQYINQRSNHFFNRNLTTPSKNQLNNFISFNNSLPNFQNISSTHENKSNILNSVHHNFQTNSTVPTNFQMKNPSSVSQIIYKSNPQVIFQKPVLQNNQNQFVNQSKFPSIVRFNRPGGQATIIKYPAPNRSISYFKRDISPLSSNVPIKVQLNNSYINKDKQLQRSQSLRWQNKYQDLKTKYYQLLSIVQKNQKIEDSWILQEQNRLLKQKIKVLQERDEKYCYQITKRIEKLIDFHHQTTLKQTQLLVDRFRLQNKFLQKI